MPTYCDLVNKVLLESGKEQDLLDEDNWDSLDASRRIYPRVKRLVREAWKAIQMSRNEWEFNSAELTTLVYPRLKYAEGWILSGMPTRWRGVETGTVIVVRNYEPTSGDWFDGNAAGQIEFEVESGSSLTTFEEFESDDPLNPGTFVYLAKGSYDFLADTLGLIREPHWSTFVAGRDSAYPVPVMYVPWDNFMYKSYSYVGSSQTAPAYLSQDFEGRLVFYPQPLAPFNLSFVYDVAPQEFMDWDDLPIHLPEEYHDWIAWEAAKNLARYDKDPDLFAYAEKMADTYQKRAERNLLPIPSYRANPFNRRVTRY